MTGPPRPPQRRRRPGALAFAGPAAIAAAVFSFRAVPPPEPDEPERARSVELPRLFGAPAPGREVRYELDAERSTVRLLVEGPGGPLWTECARVEGSLRLGPGPVDGDLDLRLDLASLRALSSEASDLDVDHVAGALGGAEARYRGRLVARTVLDLPGVDACDWVGTIRSGPRVLRQSMRLWRCALPARPLRLSGHGTVDGLALGLPGRTWLGPFTDRHAVTLGLDLAWRRVRDR